MYKPLKCYRVIVACFILHNLCVQNNLPFEADDDEDESDDNDGENLVAKANAVGLQVRRQLINARFA